MHCATLRGPAVAPLLLWTAHQPSPASAHAIIAAASSADATAPVMPRSLAVDGHRMRGDISFSAKP